MHVYDRAKAAARSADRELRRRAAGSPWREGLYEFGLFGVKQAWACLFGGAMLGLSRGGFVGAVIGLGVCATAAGLFVEERRFYRR